MHQTYINPTILHNQLPFCQQYNLLTPMNQCIQQNTNKIQSNNQANVYPTPLFQQQTGFFHIGNAIQPTIPTFQITEDIDLNLNVKL